MQQRLPKFRREPGALINKRITPRSLAIIDAIHRHRLLPTSLLVRLVPGDTRQTQQHLQMLFHRGLVNRFAFPKVGRAGEFHYYLDNTQALDLLVREGSHPDDLDYEGVRRNKEKSYADIHNPAKAEEAHSRLLFLQHEAMISRFHATLELACVKTNGAVVLASWRQGASLWHQVRAPKLSYRGVDMEGNRIYEESGDEVLPHRPDAFFSLYYPNQPEGKQWASFIYEADRKTTNVTRHNRKLRAHFQFIVKQKLHELTYGIKRIRAVLIETLDDAWAEHLRQAAADYEVSGPKPSPLFWFTTSRLFTQPQVSGVGEGSLPTYLTHPEIIFQPIWATPADERAYSLLD
ncbi:MAG: replication-relaxation family protein [Acidobacteriota bacterium]|nr:replication-relaxation family protein [Acidobacteriota bacterium]